MSFVWIGFKMKQAEELTFRGVLPPARGSCSWFLVGEGDLLETLKSSANGFDVLLGCPLIGLHVTKLTEGGINVPDALAELAFESTETLLDGFQRSGVVFGGVLPFIVLGA